MNFRIIESKEPKYVEKYDEFIKLYNNQDITVINIRKKLGWSHGTYRQALTKALNDGDVVNRNPNSENISRKRVRREPKYYHYHNITNKYMVRKLLPDKVSGEKKLVYFGVYKSLPIVKRVVEELKNADWDKEKLHSIQENVKKELGVEEL